MAIPLAQVFWDAAMTSFGSNILLFATAVIAFAAIFFITRQSLSSSLVLGVVAMDGMGILANEPFIDLLLLTLKVLIVGVVGFGIATSVFKK